MVFGERRQPEGELGKVGGHRVFVDAVEALLGDEPLGEEELVFVGRNGGHAAVALPGHDEMLGELAAGLDEERPRAHGRVTDLEIEELSRRGLLAEVCKDRFEGLADDRLGELARGVVGAGAAAFVARHEEHRPRGEGLRRGRPSDLLGGFEGGEQVVDRLRRFERIGLLGRELVVGGRFKGLGPIGGLRGEQGVEIHRHRGAMFLLRLDGDRWPVGEADTKPHHHFIDAADLLDIERSVAQALAIKEQELVEHPVDRPIGDQGKSFVRGFSGGRGPGGRAIALAFQPGKPIGIEEIARPGGQLEVGV